jgi:cyclic beta-1,2-glucan synthetase
LKARAAVNRERGEVWAGLEMPPNAHVGYYLLADGREVLEEALGYEPAGSVRLRRWLLKHPTLVYLGSMGLVSILILGGLLLYARAAGGTLLQLLLAFFILLIPVTGIAVGLVNWLLTHLIQPRVLPKLDFSEGVPAQASTVVVIPAMLTSEDEARSLLRQLELHHLRNPDPKIRYALLTDFADAESETVENDDRLLAVAEGELQAMNERHDGKPFYLFHRRRQWNEKEGVWMGWERKRGKLHEFNRLLRGAPDTSYVVQEGDLSNLDSMQYVITLDADTVLPRESAHCLIGALAHPLNRAQFDPQTGEVVSGYTVLQPRTEIQPTSATQSLFTRVFAGDAGLDLYTLAVSDIYQDLFGEGIYVGKGIYDVDAFERSLEGKVPENALLSHDLFEGIQGRAGLVTDVVLYEDYPPHYLVHVRRSHRWVRGDWQLLPWLLPRFLRPEGYDSAHLDVIDWWKIVDNLRRSLNSPALLLLFIAGWTFLPGSALLWTLLGLLAPAVSLGTSLLMAIMRGIGGAPGREIVRPVRDSAVRWLLYLAFLPYESILVLDAVITTLLRRRSLNRWA